jgi:NAD(P)-dependent dehydrogenase (short-subunit alcohol dehydrogenase family)
MTSNKFALVTGAASGIGFRISQKLAQLGYRVILTDVNESALQSATEQIPDSISYAFDIRIEADIAKIAATIAEKYGNVEVLVNAAGVFFEHDIASVTEDEYDLIMDVNVKGMYLMCKHFIPQLLKSGNGNIVNISSTAGLRGSRNRPIYSASKAAVIMLTKSIANDYGAKGIRANVICPGLIDTPMADWIRQDPERLNSWAQTIPAQRIGTVEDIASGVAYLISPEASYLHGHSLIIDGGGSA